MVRFFMFLCLLCLPFAAGAQELTTCAAINQVDDEGKATFAGLQTADRYTIEGIAINDPFIFNDGATQSLILFIQDETGGIQVFSGSFYGGGMAIYQSVGVKTGDRVQVTGLTGFYGGKTNMNDRHNKDNTLSITILDSPGEPAPLPITDLAAAQGFDQTQQTGGEYYQGRLVVLKNVRIVDGEWEPGAKLTVQDPSGNPMVVELRHQTEIADSPKPDGLLDITGVFNQEDTEAPFTDGYLLWPRTIQDFQPATSGSSHWALYP